MVSILDGASDSGTAAGLRALFEPLLNTRTNLLLSVDSCTRSDGLYQERMVMLKRFLAYPLTWRFREALTALLKSQPLTAANSSKMTRHLHSQLRHCPNVTAFYFPALRSLPVSFAYTDLFGYFLDLNSVRDLDEFYAHGAVFEGGEDERILISISIRRLLLMLLTPSKIIFVRLFVCFNDSDSFYPNLLKFPLTFTKINLIQVH